MLLEKELATTTSRPRQEHLARFRGTVVCRECGGSRLRPEANSVRLGGKTIYETTCETVSAARQFFSSLEFAQHEQDVAHPLIEEIERRLDFLERVGKQVLRRLKGKKLQTSKKSRDKMRVFCYGVV